MNCMHNSLTVYVSWRLACDKVKRIDDHLEVDISDKTFFEITDVYDESIVCADCGDDFGQAVDIEYREES